MITNEEINDQTQAVGFGGQLRNTHRVKLERLAKWAYEKGQADRDKLAAAIEAMRVAGGASEFQMRFDQAKALIGKT